MKKLTLFVFVLGMLSTLSLSAADSRLSGEVSFDYYTDYIWRGIKVSDDPSFQPGASISIADVGPGAITLGYWGSSYLADAHSDEANTIENDYTFAYGLDLGPVSAEFGAIYYTFAGGTGDGFSYTEIYGSFGMGLIDGESFDLGASFAVYYDTDDTKGAYYNLGLGAEFAVTKDITAGLSASVGYGDSRHNVEYYSNDGKSIADIIIEASVGMPLNETFSLSAAVGYINVPNGDFDDGLVVAEDDAYAKVGISASF